ncbi:exodeoxyribonuclease V beta subunit [Kutzneria buriramensis]|uniref:Exodeoxyribonuclease V beta subunit n=1 Tax=Kutzneria buriramensis TaxID=1045776 RepID=A0A3E0HG88_9PSEU|nr:exodeoxyribonuclease V beta subunit [Kutzneria buriramensis]
MTCGQRAARTPARSRRHPVGGAAARVRQGDRHPGQAARPGPQLADTGPARRDRGRAVPVRRGDALGQRRDGAVPGRAGHHTQDPDPGRHRGDDGAAGDARERAVQPERARLPRGADRRARPAPHAAPGSQCRRTQRSHDAAVGVRRVHTSFPRGRGGPARTGRPGARAQGAGDVAAGGCAGRPGGGATACSRAGRVDAPGQRAGDPDPAARIRHPGGPGRRRTCAQASPGGLSSVERRRGAAGRDANRRVRRGFRCPAGDHQGAARPRPARGAGRGTGGRRRRDDRTAVRRQGSAAVARPGDHRRRSQGTGRGGRPDGLLRRGGGPVLGPPGPVARRRGSAGRRGRRVGPGPAGRRAGRAGGDRGRPERRQVQVPALLPLRPRTRRHAEGMRRALSRADRARPARRARAQRSGPHRAPKGAVAGPRVVRPRRVRRGGRADVGAGVEETAARAPGFRSCRRRGGAPRAVDRGLVSDRRGSDARVARRAGSIAW